MLHSYWMMLKTGACCKVLETHAEGAKRWERSKQHAEGCKKQVRAEGCKKQVRAVKLLTFYGRQKPIAGDTCRSVFFLECANSFERR